jgi:hypothetical protein
MLSQQGVRLCLYGVNKVETLLILGQQRVRLRKYFLLSQQGWRLFMLSVIAKRLRLCLVNRE